MWIKRVVSSCSQRVNKFSTDQSDYLKSRLSKVSRSNYYQHVESECPMLSRLDRASVLVAINSDLNSNNKTYFTFSKRAEKMKSFGGQNCFVGGRRDVARDESDVATACREANEEIGINTELLTLLAELCPIITYTGVLVTPIVAYYDKRRFVPQLNNKEVDFIFDLPTERFLAKRDLTMKRVTSGRSEYLMHTFRWNDDGHEQQIEGITSFISIYVASLIHNKRPEFELVPGMTNMDLLNDPKYLQHFLIEYSKDLIASLVTRQQHKPIQK